MAERRMISKKITDTDAFLDMPLSTQALYFHFIQNADDDGFVGNPNSIIRKIGANKNDYDLLIAKRFIITFETGICVIKHWRIHNYIQSDRYTPTTYLKEKSMLTIEENKAYTEQNLKCIQDVYIVDTQNSIDKNSIDKNKIIQSQPDMSMFSDKVKESIENWLNYKKEKKQGYKPTGLKTLLKKLKQDYDSYGEQYVIDSIDNSIVNNYSGIFAPNKSYQKPKQTNVSQKEYKVDENGLFGID